jgi:exodeoxyribonuclease III
MMVTGTLRIVRIATWNVNSLNERLPRVIEFLTQHRPDVLLLQGTGCEPGGFPEAELAGAGYDAVHHSAGHWAGVAIAVPAGVGAGEVCIGLQGEPSADEARWIEADVDGMRAISVNVPSDRLRFLEAAAARIRELAAAGPLVVGGDFDVTRIGPDERERYAALLDAGTVDAFGALHPDEPRFTLLLSPGLARRLRACGEAPAPSDHAPLLAELE